MLGSRILSSLASSTTLDMISAVRGSSSARLSAFTDAGGEPAAPRDNTLWPYGAVSEPCPAAGPSPWLVRAQVRRKAPWCDERRDRSITRSRRCHRSMID